MVNRIVSKGIGKQRVLLRYISNGRGWDCDLERRGNSFTITIPSGIYEQVNAGADEVCRLLDYNFGEVSEISMLASSN